MSNEKEQNQTVGRQNPTNELPKNPSAFFLSWKSAEESFVYWDKNKGKEGENVKMPMPLTFIPVYRCFAIRGYNHKKNISYISNEVKDLNSEVLVVKSYNNITKENKVEWKGLYSEVKSSLDQNCKFTVSLYAGIKKKDKSMALVNFQLNGAGIHHWFDFSNENDIWKGAIKVSKFTKEVNGKVEYNAPVYELVKISSEEDVEAGKLQKVITEYLETYFERNKASNVNSSQPSSSESKASVNENKHQNSRDSKTSEGWGDEKGSTSNTDWISNQNDETDIPF